MKLPNLLIIGIFISIGVYGQKPTTGFGKVTREDLEMNIYEPDTTASAVVLYQSGHFRESDFRFIFYRRVKVLRKEGSDYAEYTFRADENTSVRGTTYNLVDGKIVQEKLGKGSIFKQMITKGVWLYRIAMPNVREGTVFEIEYNHLFVPAEFKFQDIIPVLRAELILEPNYQINFRKTKVGYTSVKTNNGIFFYADYSPAFKPEGYSYSPENYITKFDFDILSITLPGNHMTFTTDWASVNKVLLEDLYFGKVVGTSSAYLNALRDEIESKNLPPPAKARAAYDAIQKISWNGEERIYSTGTTLRVQFIKGSANSAEINMMFAQLLEKLGFKTSLVALSTRDNGLLHPIFPSLQKLNYTVVYTEIDGTPYVLDVTDRFAPFGLLPVRCLNEQGRLIVEGEGKWIDLNPSQPDKQIIDYKLAVNSSQALEGEVLTVLNGYGAYNIRTEYNKYPGEERFIDAIEAANPGLTVSDYEFMDFDNINSDCSIKMKMEMKGKVRNAGEMLMIYPFMMEQMSDNPFKTEARVYPVNFIYKRMKDVTVNIKIPEGYSVETLPPALNLKTGDNNFNITVKYEVTDNHLILKYVYDLKKITFMPEEYPEIREMYNKLITKQSEPVILKKVTDVDF